MSEHPHPEPETPDLSDEVESAAALTDRVVKLESELADANAKHLRLGADFQNAQRRALQNEVQAKLQGMAAVVQSIVGVLDHFDLALNVDQASASAAQVVEGVKVIRGEFVKVLQGHGVGIILPAQGEEFIPGRHEAVMQQDVAGLAPNCIAACLAPGYSLTVGQTERIVRPAKVAVTPQP
jgi:molecular chaperone GrpE